MGKSILTITIYLFSLFGCSQSLLPSITDQTEAIDTAVLPKTVMIVRGVITKKGDGVQKMTPLTFRENKRQLKTPFPDIKNGLFELHIVYQNNQEQKVPFNAIVVSDGELITHGFFELYLPIYGEIEQMEIRITKTAITLYKFDKNEFN